MLRIVTLLQCIGIGRFMGIRLPVIMSVTFAAATPMIAIGMTRISACWDIGATIAAGFITTLLAPLIGRLMPLFPPLVTGVVITSIGLSIIQVGIYGPPEVRESAIWYSFIEIPLLS
ncbi:solute carrier family 23 protein [Escherichia coli]